MNVNTKPTPESTALARWIPPAPQRHPLTPILLLIIVLALFPAIALAWQRISYEQSQRTTALVMDYPALVSQARRYGRSPADLLQHYKSLGVNGLALYEDVVSSLEQRGEMFSRTGAELLVQFPNDSNIKPNNVYLRSLVAGTVEKLAKRYTIPTNWVSIGGNKWLEWPTDPRFLPAGPNQQQIAEFKKQGLVLVYRPYDDEAVKEVATDWPDVPFIAFTGDEVIGARTPERLEKVSQRMGQRLPAVIEANPQRGLEDLVEKYGAVRLFSLNPSWQNRLEPQATASKYNLAARERGMRLLYLRPYPTINETEDLLKRTSELLKSSGIAVTMPVISNFQANVTMQWLAALGPLAALVLLGLSYPLPRIGLAMAGFSLLLCLLLNYQHPLAALALVAAITFPALGLVMRRQHTSDWLWATGLSLAGVLFVSGLGTTRESILGLEPFRGVGLTLLLPILLAALSFLPPQDLRTTAAQLYNIRLKLGDVALMALALGLFVVMFLRRGNTTGGSISALELDLRQNLQDSLVRPRFKEIAGHPLGILGLSGAVPSYFGPLLMLGGVMGQASILNTFSHFHTPLLISAQRCFLGLGLGLLSGLLLTFAFKYGLQMWQNLAKPTHLETPTQEENK